MSKFFILFNNPIRGIESRPPIPMIDGETFEMAMFDTLDDAYLAADDHIMSPCGYLIFDINDGFS